MAPKSIFIESAHVPSVSAGEYRIKVISRNELLPDVSEIAFKVSGYRDRIPGNEILSVYPPRSGIGNYAGSFPSVQFRRSSLPWDFKNDDSQGERVPYLFLSLFEESEMEFEGKLNDPSRVLYRQANGAQLEMGDVNNKMFNYLEVPRQLGMTLPEATEMKYLSHVRVGQDEENGPENGQQDTAVVIAKRMVKPNKKYHAFVGVYLLKEGGRYYLSLKKKENAVNHLIILSEWQFESNHHNAYQYNESKFEGLKSVAIIKSRKTKHPVLEGEEKLIKYLERASKQYAGILAQLESGGEERSAMLSLLKYEGKTLRGMLQELQFSELSYRLPTVSSHREVNDLISIGKIPLLHRLKSGGKTVSWYQGPFVRSHHALSFKGLSGSPEIGFDLGEDIPDHSERLIFYNEQSKMLDMGYAAAWQLGRILAIRNPKILKEIQNWKYQLQLGKLIAAQNEEYSPVNFVPDFSVRKLPDLSRNFVMDLLRFNDFPYYYLIPHHSLLPNKTVSYFKLDNSWMISLLFGIFSIGEAFSIQEFRSYVLNDSVIRTYFDFNKEYFGVLIHSEIFENWPQLTVEVNDQTAYIYTTDLAAGVRLLMSDQELSRVSIFSEREHGHFAMEIPYENAAAEMTADAGLLSFTKNGEMVHYSISGYEGNAKHNRMPFDLLSKQPKVIFEILKANI